MSQKDGNVSNRCFARLSKAAYIELNLFLLALSFFTRIPVPNCMRYSEVLLNKSNRYFSLVGLFLGCLLSLCYLILSVFLPIPVAVLLTMSISLLLTGAFHEDGLADMVDGIGGAFSIEKRLIIMKDSRIGTYGTSALFMALLLKFSLLVELARMTDGYVVMAFILSAALSRAVAGSFIACLPYVSDVQDSKSKPLAQAQSSQERKLLLAIGVLPLIFLPVTVIITLILLMIIFHKVFKHWLIAKLGGFTGDCLGAAQQISELLIYIVLVVYWSNLNGVII